MSGHNKWSTIKHRKGAQDAKRGKIFSKVIKEITVATKMGGPALDGNSRLRSALEWAKSVNMPGTNIQKAIQKGSGGMAANYENITYEGYGPHQVAVIVECLTDNRNRTVSSVRYIFQKNRGNLGSTNSVQYQFERRGIIEIDKKLIEESTLYEYALEAGAEDIQTTEQNFEVLTKDNELHEVSASLTQKKLTIKSTQITLLPKNKVELTDAQQAKQVLHFLDALENDDDVQKVHTNLALADSVLETLETE